MLLYATDLVVTVGARTLLKTEKLEVHDGDRIGLIGKNGVGKTTLFKVLAGIVPAESGKIERYAQVEYVPQLKRQDVEKSGGEITQQYIQTAFSKQSGVLLADEPTTHLDTKHIEWVENTLNHWQGAFIVISHDRTFLDHVCNVIWEIEDETIKIYPGNYSKYKQLKEQQEEQAWAEYEKYIAKKKQLEIALRLKTDKAARATKKPKQTSQSEAKITGAKPYFAKKQKKLHQAAKAMESRIEKLEKVEKPFEEPPLKMELPNEAKMKNRTIVQVNELEGRIGSRLLWNPVSFSIQAGEKVAIVGNNGTGKTTLINKILRREDGVKVSPVCQIGYFRQDLSLLDEDRSILDNVMEGSKQSETMIRTVLARLHFRRDDVYKKVKVLSGGERVKVALAKIFVSDSNTLVLDEPTNFLDIEAMEALEKLLIDYEGTLLFVSHDRMFVEKIANKILEIKDQQIIIRDSFNVESKEVEEVGTRDEQLLVIETKITDVLSRLSTEPSPGLEEEFQRLVQEKKKLLEGKK